MTSGLVTRRLFQSGAAAFTLAALSACDWKSRRDPALSRISIGISPFQDTLLPIFGVRKGWYKDAGLDPDFKILGWTEVQEALSSSAANRIDVGINNVSSVVATHHRNPQLAYLYGFNTFDDGFALLARPGGRIKPLSQFLAGRSRPEAIKATAQQLQGTVVVTTSNTDMEQGVAAAARRGGLSFRQDLKILNLAPDEGLAAFLSGSGDAYIGGLPQRFRAVKEGMVEILTGADLGPAPINGYVGTKAYWEQNPLVVTKLIDVWFRIVTYINANLDEGAAVISEELNKRAAAGFTPDDFKAIWNRTEHFMASAAEVQQNILDPQGRNYWRNRWDDCNTYFHEIAKIIPAKVSANDAFLMEEVQAALLEGR